MNYKIQDRINNILRSDKMSNPQSVCNIIKEEIKPIINNYLTLQKEIVVRYRTENNKNIFFIELEAERIKPFGYIPY